MTRKLPPLNAVRAFEAAARHVSFTKAAAELNVTHGAVSRQVALLESWLGIPLFRRTPSQLVLLDAGRGYLAEVTAVLDRLSLASMHLLDQAAPTALTISAPPTFTMRWLIARMSGFQRRRPDVEIRMTTSLAPVQFDHHEYDVAIRGAHGPIAGTVSIPFMTELILPVCHVDLLDRGLSGDPTTLAQHTLINYTTEPYAWADWLTAAGLSHFKPLQQMNFEQMFFALQAATEGLGVVLVPLFLAIDDILAGKLCTPFGPLGAKQREYFSSAASRNPVVDSFNEWLLDQGRQTEASIAAWARSAGWAAL
jgi:LysR family glycine cleavage system transcriptional activator